MFSFTTLICLALSSPLLVSGLAVKRFGCDVSNVAISRLPPTLAQPTTKGSWVGIAIGTQNYTCGSAGTYTNIGALAELFDISCLVNTPVFASLPDIAIDAWEAASPAVTAQQLFSTFQAFPNPFILGQHYYVKNPVTGTGINPKWDFTSGADAGKSDAFVVAAKVASAAAVTGSQDIDWVFLSALSGEGSLAKQVYRTDTRLGQPPASCVPGSSPIVVKYAAKYWGFGGSV